MLTFVTIRSILLIVRWSTKSTEQVKRNELFLNKKEYAVVAELAYAHDSGSCEHYAREGSSPSNCTKRTFSWMFAFHFLLSDYPNNCKSQESSSHLFCRVMRNIPDFHFFAVFDFQVPILSISVRGNFARKRLADLEDGARKSFSSFIYTALPAF